MAKYGGFKYQETVEDGGKLYGGAAIPSLSVGNFSALVVDYNHVTVTWSNPVGNFRRFRLIRNQEGIPDTEEDGVILIDRIPALGDSEKLEDLGVDANGNPAALITGRHVYYSIWLWLEDEENRWYLAGSTYSTVPSQHTVMAGTPTESTTHTRLMESLPKVMTSADLNAFGTVDYESDLAKFLEGISFTADQIMTLADLLVPNSTFINLTPELLNSYGLNLGIAPENNLGNTPTKFQRLLLRNALNIYQEKGTTQALAMFVEAITGFNVQLTQTTNLMLTAQDSTFYRGVGNWTAGTGVTLTSSNDSNDTEVPTTGEAEEDELTYRVDESYFGKVVTTGSAQTISNGTTSPITKGIPVEPDVTYVVSLYQKTSATATYTITVNWHDYLGNIISSDVSSTISATSTWERAQFTTGSSPTNAAYATLSIAFSATGTYYLDMVNFAEMSYPQFSEARGIGINLSSSKQNLINNPSFEANTDGWTVANATATDTLFDGDEIPGQYSGDQYLLLESSSSAEVSLSTETDPVVNSSGPITLSLFGLSDGTPATEYTATLEAYAVESSSNNYVDTVTPTSGSTTGWMWTDATGGTATITYPTTGGPISNDANVLVTYSAQPTSGDQVISIDSTGLTPTLLDNAEYTFSIYIKPAEERSVYPSVEWDLYDTTTVEENGDSVVIPAGQWTKVSYTVTAPSGVSGIATLSLTLENTDGDFGVAYADASLSPVSYSAEETWTLLNGSWSRKSIGLDIPVDANLTNPLKVSFSLSYTSNGNDVKLDAVQLESGEFVTDYFDGSFFNAEWANGVANANDSVSNMYANKEAKLASLQAKIRNYIPMSTPFWIATESGVEFNGVFKYYA